MPKKWTSEDIQKAIKRRKNIEELQTKLLKNIKATLPKMEALLTKVSGHWQAEDCTYRYYHQSFKVFYIQECTNEIVAMLKGLAPDDYPLNEDFMEIIKEGTGKEFKMEYNKEWGRHTRPLLEAFFHSRMFLEMAIKYGKELKKPPNCLPSGWALILYLFELR